MLCVDMKPRGPSTNRIKNNNRRNPLECPPSLSLAFKRKTSDGSEANSSLPGALVRHQRTATRDPAPSFATAPQIPPPSQNNQEAKIRQLQEEILSSLAAQIVSQRRSMMMNYNIPNNNLQMLSNIREETTQGLPFGSNQSLLALASNNKGSSRNSQAGFSQPTCTRVPCQARGMSTDHNALVSYPDRISGHRKRMRYSHTFRSHRLRTW